MNNKSNSLLNIFLVIFLSVLVSGCSKKIYEYRIVETVKNKQISDEELKKMNVRQFYNFIKVKENRKGMNAYIPSNSYNLVFKFCKLQNSKLKKYTPVLGSTTVLNLEGNLKAANRIVDYATLHGCYIEKTDEYLELIRINSHTQRFKDRYRDNVINISKYSKIDYLDNINSRKKDDEKKIKEIELSNIKINKLRERTGTHSFIFNTSFINNSDYSNTCIKSCKNYNIENTGYSLLQESLDDKWEFVSKIGNVNTKVNRYCTCEGVNILMRR
ncbi:hypothetical protein [Poseidonibacter ostreae]|uniref:Lipoprotein n=1 Tax=Poseidonibacter ostreae TaxID=2654171 RepID=A0A6L4WPN2_9BACT|nr:hypothetical protein [Poseidonibacter ostreae]KAB7885191.1 hypothetical protein GA417_09165 [Poseidonibacter ostreae]KAB7886078.1 hypothetical protein GBG19_13015 [Poseidonibacter ostreae]KAB7889601.1 hypothetical protein GBG18_10630 [Poseidonibacter ostreae]